MKRKVIAMKEFKSYESLLKYLNENKLYDNEIEYEIAFSNYKWYLTIVRF